MAVDTGRKSASLCFLSEKYLLGHNLSKLFGSKWEDERKGSASYICIAVTSWTLRVSAENDD